MTREEALRRVQAWAWISDERGGVKPRSDADEVIMALSRPVIELADGEKVVRDYYSRGKGDMVYRTIRTRRTT